MHNKWGGWPLFCVENVDKNMRRQLARRNTANARTLRFIELCIFLGKAYRSTLQLANCLDIYPPVVVSNYSNSLKCDRAMNECRAMRLTSCGGTPNETVRRSTRTNWSVHGMTKNKPATQPIHKLYVVSGFNKFKVLSTVELTITRL